jgi:ribonuclease VapC
VIVDSSALVAVVFQEPGYESLLGKLTAPGPKGAGVPTLAETAIVLAVRLGADPDPVILRLLEELDIAQVPFGESHWREALRAFRRFGRGHHPAGLNFGDCLSYAVAHVAQEPLLFAGDDFARTDVQIA